MVLVGWIPNFAFAFVWRGCIDQSEFPKGLVNIDLPSFDTKVRTAVAFATSPCTSLQSLLVFRQSFRLIQRTRKTASNGLLKNIVNNINSFFQDNSGNPDVPPNYEMLVLE